MGLGLLKLVEKYFSSSQSYLTTKNDKEKKIFLSSAISPSVVLQGC